MERPRPPVATRPAVETSTSLPSGHSLMAVLGLGTAVVAVLMVVWNHKRIVKEAAELHAGDASAQA